ncbi:MAG: hypothetical protein Q9M22_01435 [Mariprofundaceae bacterium]|nr:hypothetical protein [Mariprofundaceae bacterium]
MIKRKLLIQLHLLLAASSFSIVAMFLITGALYTYNYKPSTYSTEYRIRLSKPMTRDYRSLKRIAHQELEKLGLSDPLGKAKLRKKRRHYKLVWYGRNHTITLRPSSKDHSIAVLKVKTPSWYSRFMRLHKGKGGDLFDVFSIVASVILLLTLLSGVILGLQIAVFRRLTLYALSGGLLLFSTLVVYAQFY